VRIATVQYKAGRRDLLWVAQLQTAALSTESDLIKVQSAQRVNRVRLHQVLGDSFDAAPAGTLEGTDADKGERRSSRACEQLRGTQTHAVDPAAHQHDVVLEAPAGANAVYPCAVEAFGLPPGGERSA
jgi:hypothetical protein